MPATCYLLFAARCLGAYQRAACSLALTWWSRSNPTCSSAPLLLSPLPSERIYAQKPNLGAHGVTWSQENYAHKGLQIEYLRLKSIQRFTETWAALQRCYNAGGFAYLETPAVAEEGECPGDEGAGEDTIYRVASLGGGPGFELLAIKAFFAEKVLSYPVSLFLPSRSFPSPRSPPHRCPRPTAPLPHHRTRSCQW